MQTFSEETRAAIALGWAKSGLTQDEYADQFGIAARTLRLWLDRYASEQPPLAEARAVLADAIQRLQALLAAVDAETACREEDGSATPALGLACRPATALADVHVEPGAVGACRSAAASGAAPGTARHADLNAFVAGVHVDLAKGRRAPSEPNSVTASPPRPKQQLRTGGFFATMDAD